MRTSLHPTQEAEPVTPDPEVPLRSRSMPPDTRKGSSVNLRGEASDATGYHFKVASSAVLREGYVLVNEVSR